MLKASIFLPFLLRFLLLILYFSSSDSIPCPYDYLGSGNQCESCPFGYWGDSNTNTCVTSCPNSNQYGDVSDHRKCNTCNANCLTCSGKAIACLTCPTNYYLHDIDQVCYLTCPSTYYANLLTGKCIDPCPIGYFPDSPTKKCTICHASCYTCSGDGNTDCISCIADYFLYNSNSCVKDCPVGYWGDSNTKTCVTSCPNTNQYGDVSDNRKCKTCDVNCLTCSGTAIACTSCLTNYYLCESYCYTTCPTPLYAVPATNTCDLQCPLGQFKYDFDRTCYATCPLPSFANPETEFCVDPCPDGMFKNNVEGKCTLCDFDCQTCSVSASSCLSCKENWIKSGASCLPPSNVYQIDVQLDSSFNSHTFLVNNANLQNYHTSYCGSYHILGGPNDFGQSTYISKTYTNVVPHYKIRIRFFFLKIDFWDSKTVFLYLNTSPEVLIDSKTFTSNQVSSLNLICGTANKPETLSQFDVFVNHFTSTIELKITTNLDVASSVGSWGIYDYKLYVYRCHETCLTCTGQLSNQCDTCYPNATKNANNECICNNHFYPATIQANTCTVPQCTVCTSCHSECNNCDGGSNTDCIDCSSPRFLLNKQCYLVCPSPYFGTSDNRCQKNVGCSAHTYLDETDIVCKTCHSDCDNCSGPLNTNCLSCLAPYFLLIKDGLMECVKNCGNGFVGDVVKRMCVPCETSCETCNDVTKNNCLTCKYPRYFFQNQCLTFCPSNYYANNATKACENSCPPKTYAEKKVAACWPCSPECKSCSGLSQNQCIECEPKFFLQNSSCVSNCFSGYYEVKSLMKCEPCLTDCAKCFNNTICEACNANKFLLMPEGKKCVSCLEEGYYLEASTCYLCASNCKICEDKAKCMECLSGYFQSKGKCILQGNCTNNCSICEGAASCQVCSNNYYLNQGQCLIQKIIKAELKYDELNPFGFHLKFSSYWKKGFESLPFNIRIKIFDLNAQFYSYLLTKNETDKTDFLINFNFKANITLGMKLNVKLDLPTQDEYKLNLNEFELELKEYYQCPDNNIYNATSRSCYQPITIIPMLEYGNNLDELSFRLVPDFDLLLSLIPNNTIVSIIGINFTYNFIPNGNSYIIKFNFNQTFWNKPVCSLFIATPSVFFDNSSTKILEINTVSISMRNYYVLDNSIKNAIENSKKTTEQMSSISSTATMSNSFLSGSSMAISIMMSMEIIRFLKYLDIDYPPNVEEMFKSSLRGQGIIPDIFIDVDPSENVRLPYQFAKYNNSIYVFNNNGNFLIENIFYLGIGLIFLELESLINRKNQNKHFKKIIELFTSIFTWNFTITYFLGVFINYIFFDLLFFKFPAVESVSGKFNMFYATSELLLIIFALVYVAKILSNFHNEESRNKISVFQKHDFISIDNNSYKLELSSTETPHKKTSIKAMAHTKTEILKENNLELDSNASLHQKKQNIFQRIKTAYNKFFDRIGMRKKVNAMGKMVNNFFSNQNQNKTANDKDLELSKKTGDHLKSRFGCLNKGLNHKNRGQAFYLLFDILRQTIISFMIVFLFDYPIAAMIIVNYANLNFFVLIAFIRPQRERLDQIQTIINELCVNLACFATMALAIMERTGNEDPQVKLNVGWIIVATNIIFMSVFLGRFFLTILILIGKQLIQLIKKGKQNSNKVAPQEVGGTTDTLRSPDV